jgi:hypothetical protein
MISARREQQGNLKCSSSPGQDLQPNIDAELSWKGELWQNGEISPYEISSANTGKFEGDPAWLCEVITSFDVYLLNVFLLVITDFVAQNNLPSPPKKSSWTKFVLQSRVHGTES